MFALCISVIINTIITVYVPLESVNYKFDSVILFWGVMSQMANCIIFRMLKVLEDDPLLHARKERNPIMTHNAGFLAFAGRGSEIP